MQVIESKCLGEPTMKTIIAGIDGSHAAITAGIVGLPRPSAERGAAAIGLSDR